MVDMEKENVHIAKQWVQSYNGIDNTNFIVCMSYTDGLNRNVHESQNRDSFSELMFNSIRKHINVSFISPQLSRTR